VAVARAIIGSPNLILADEPIGNLDSSNGEEIMSLLTGLHARGTTVIIVTHAEAYAEYSQRIIHLFDGHIVAEDDRINNPRFLKILPISDRPLLLITNFT
jgi:putative ABC transport system ATP-binding protein